MTNTIVLMALLLMLAPLSACKTGESDPSEEDSNTSGLWGSSAEKRVSNLGKSLDETGTKLLGVLTNTENDHFYYDMEGLPCEIRVLWGEKSKWRGQKPSFHVYALRPENPGDFSEKSYFNHERNKDQTEVEYGSSLSPSFKKITSNSETKLRAWTKSGLIILAKTGYADLVYASNDKLIRADFGDYTKGIEKHTGSCILETPY